MNYELLFASVVLIELQQGQFTGNAARYTLFCHELHE